MGINPLAMQSVNLGFLPATNNSACFSSTDSVIVPISTWNNITLSSSGGSLEVNISDVDLSNSGFQVFWKV